jgi:hypothetical protein
MMMDDGEYVELVSFAPGGVSIGTGLLGATGRTPEEARQNRMLEIERRILAIEERLTQLPPNKDQSNAG